MLKDDVLDNLELTRSFYDLAVMPAKELAAMGHEPIEQLLTYLNDVIIKSDVYDHNIPKPHLVLDELDAGALQITMRDRTRRRGRDIAPIALATIERDGQSRRVVWNPEITFPEFTMPQHKKYKVLAAAVPDVYATILDIIDRRYSLFVFGLNNVRFNLHPLYLSLEEAVDEVLHQKMQEAAMQGKVVEFFRSYDHVLMGGQRSLNVFASRDDMPLEEQFVYANSFALARFQVGQSILSGFDDIGVKATRVNGLLTIDDVRASLLSVLDTHIAGINSESRPGCEV